MLDSFIKSPKPAQHILAEEDMALISNLIPARSFDPETGIYLSDAGVGIVLEIQPLTGLNETAAIALRSILVEMKLEDVTVQFIGWSTNRTGQKVVRWQNTRRNRHTGTCAARRDMFENLATGSHEMSWRPRHISSFICVMLPQKTALSQQGQLQELIVRFQHFFTSVGASSRWVQPSRLLSVYQEMVLPELDAFSPAYSGWSELEFLNEQLIHPGITLQVGRTSLQWSNGVEAKTYVVKNSHSSGFRVRQLCLTGICLSDFGFVPIRFYTQSLLSPHQIYLRKYRHFVRHVKNRNHVLLCGISFPIFRKKKRLGEGYTGNCKWCNHLSDGNASGAVCADGKNGRCRTVFTKFNRNLRLQTGFRGWVAPASFCSAMPLGGHHLTMQAMKKLGRTRKMFMGNAVSLAPLFGEWQGNDGRNPAVLLLNGRKGGSLAGHRFSLKPISMQSL